MLLKWTKKRLKISLLFWILLKSRFPYTKEFIENTLQEECEKEKIAVEEVILYKFKSKKLA